MRRYWQAVALGAVAASLMLGWAAHAQPMMDPLRQLALSSEDLAMANETVRALYEADRIGVTETWSNPKSGNSGSARIIDTFEYQGLPCRTVEYTVKIRREADTKRVVLEACREADGAWKLI